MNVKDFVKDKDFANAGGADAEPFPEGDTTINMEVVEVEPKMVTFEDKLGKPVEKQRYILSVGDKKLWAPPSLLSDMKSASENGFSLVKVTRTGQMLKTKYKVMPVNVARAGSSEPVSKDVTPGEQK